MVRPDDEEVAGEDSFDEFSAHFSGAVPPRTMVTTSAGASEQLLSFLEEILLILPNSEYRKRGSVPIKEIVDACASRGFTNLLVFTEKARGPPPQCLPREPREPMLPLTSHPRCTLTPHWRAQAKVAKSMWMIKLPHGPTAHFKLTSIVLPKRIAGHGRPTAHRPELILNHFSTRLGHRLGRMLATLFPHDPQFKGRQARRSGRPTRAGPLAFVARREPTPRASTAVTRGGRHEHVAGVHRW